MLWPLHRFSSQAAYALGKLKRRWRTAALWEWLFPAGDRTGARPRILVVIGELAVGGVEIDIVRNVPRINRAAFDVRVYEFSHPGALGAAPA